MYLIFLFSVCVDSHVYIESHGYSCVNMSEEDFRPYGAEVTRSCELLDLNLGARKYTQVFGYSSNCF